MSSAAPGPALVFFGYALLSGPLWGLQHASPIVGPRVCCNPCRGPDSTAALELTLRANKSTIIIKTYALHNINIKLHGT